jgi:hypothetical protein
MTLAFVAAAAVLTGRQTVRSQQPALVEEGRQIFRFDTFGDERFWTDVLLMNEVIETAVDPTTALSVGLKVDADAVPPGVLASTRRPRPGRIRPTPRAARASATGRLPCGDCGIARPTSTTAAPPPSRTWSSATGARLDWRSLRTSGRTWWST